MSVAASINILLRGNTKDLDSKLAIVEKKLRSFASMFSTGGFFSGDAFKQEFEAIEQLGRISERLGIPTEKLAGLRAAANLTGISFEELTGAMQKMLVAVSGSGDPLKKAAADTAFNKLGISAASLKGLAPEKMLSAIGDALAKVGNVADRVNITKSIFGKGGVPMLNVLHDGSVGLEKLQKLTEKAGSALKSVDVNKIIEANASIKIMKEHFRGLIDQLETRFPNAIKTITKFFDVLSEVVLPFVEKYADWFVYLIKLTVLYRAVMWTVVAVERAWAVVSAATAAIKTGGWAGIAKIVTQIAAAGGAVFLLNKAFDELEKKLKSIGDETLPKFGEDAIDMDAIGGNSLPKHPAALIKGSVEAYSAIVNAGGSLTGKIEKNTKRGADNGAAILKQLQKAPMVRPANLGGVR